MAKYDKPITRSRTPAPPLEQQRAIAAQTEAFLASGGTIQQIPNGVSGQRWGVPDAAKAGASAQR